MDSNATGLFSKSSAPFSKSNYDSSDYGALFHAALKLPFGNKWFISSDAIWELGIKVPKRFKATMDIRSLSLSSEHRA